MSSLKNMFYKLFTMLGYELHRSSDQRVSFNNFRNLSQAYEQRLNEVNEIALAVNEIRPELLARLSGTLPAEAYYIIHALEQSKTIEGDICEFGVAQGETSALIANEIAAGSKTFHLFDSFEGLPKPTAEDQLKDDIFSLGSMEAYYGEMSFPEDMVLARLNAISFPENRLVLHKGFIDKVLENDSNLPEKVSFAFVDFDFYEPIKQALEYLHQVTSKGSIIIVDDYDYFSTGAKTATDEFVEAMNSDQAIYECLVPNTHYGYFAVVSRIA